MFFSLTPPREKKALKKLVASVLNKIKAHERLKEKPNLVGQFAKFRARQISTYLQTISYCPVFKKKKNVRFNLLSVLLFIDGWLL